MPIVEFTPPPRGVYAWRTPYRIEGVSGSIFWRWNEQHQSWSIHLLRSDGTKLAGPIGLAPGVDLLEGWRHFDVPPGELRVESSEGIPLATSFGRTARLVYEGA